jgi:hypothetical protein
VREFLEAIVSRRRDPAQLLPQSLGIGTGGDEFFVGRDAMLAVYAKQDAELPPLAGMRAHDVAVSVVGDAAVVQFRCVLRMRAGTDVVTLPPLRWSATLVRADGVWRFLSFHVSAPMHQQPAGRFLPELEELVEEKRTLERLIAERTRALAEERARVEEILRRELAHQVAERSRELGAALARMEGAVRAAPLLPSARFGARYRIVRPIGEGGMGAVFEVERTSDGARLALKVMTGSVSASHAARFAREAEIGARLRDPHLVSIVDVGIADSGAPFLVMELVTGGSLERMRERYGDVGWALPILRGVAAGLVALHEGGVVHRDLKPANVLLDEVGVAKVGDFGIARLEVLGASEIDAGAPTVAQESPLVRTGTGAWIGTPVYMAPEAAHGARGIGPASDLFAFGILAHELLTGAAPFATPPVLLALTGQDVPRPARIDREGLSASAADAIGACLAAAPADRPTARALLTALDG